jgi:hypothetical protein
VLDPLDLGRADISIWIVVGDEGAVPSFNKVGGRNIRVRRIGAAPPPPPALLPVLASASAFASEEQQQEKAEKKDGERLASRLRMLKALHEEGVLPEPLYHRAAGDELAAWTRRGHGLTERKPLN